MRELVDVAVVGATGLVGETILSILAERKFPVGNLYPLASKRSAGEHIRFNGKTYTVTDAEEFDFSKVQIALFSAGGSVSAQYVPKAAAAGCISIDNTSHFRYEADVPLVISEVNPHAIADYKVRNIIANPNCSTMQMLVALKPIFDAVGLTRIDVATYQSVSGAGRQGVEELASQTAKLLNAQAIEPKKFPLQIAFNVLPHIDEFQENGYTKEEMKMVWETHKILENNEIEVNPTTVRVPVFYGHSEAVHVQTIEPITAEQARKLLSKAPGVKVLDKLKGGGYATPVSNGAGTDAVYVSRIRNDLFSRKGLNLWVVADNIRKGAALNAVQIAEILVKKYLK